MKNLNICGTSLIGGIIGTVAVGLLVKSVKGVIKLCTTVSVCAKSITESNKIQEDIDANPFEKVFKDNCKIVKEDRSIMTENEVDQFIELGSEFCRTIAASSEEYRIDKFLLDDIVSFVISNKYDDELQLRSNEEITKLTHYFDKKYDKVQVSNNTLYVTLKQTVNTIPLNNNTIQLCKELNSIMPTGTKLLVITGGYKIQETTVLQIITQMMSIYVMRTLRNMSEMTKCTKAIKELI